MSVASYAVFLEPLSSPVVHLTAFYQVFYRVTHVAWWSTSPPFTKYSILSAEQEEEQECVTVKQSAPDTFAPMAAPEVVTSMKPVIYKDESLLTSSTPPEAEPPEEKPKVNIYTYLL